MYRRAVSGLIIPACIPERRPRPTAFSFFAGAGGMTLGMIQAGFEVVGANEYSPEATLTFLTNLASYPVQIHYIDGEGDKARLNKACERYIFGGKGKTLPKNIGDKIYNENTGSMLAGSGWIKHNPDQAPVRNFWFGDIRKLKGSDILGALGMQPGEIDCVFGGPPCQGFSTAGKREVMDPRNSLVFEFAQRILELQPKTFVMENVPGIVSMLDPDGVPVIDKFAMMVSEGGYGKWDKIKQGMLMQAGCAAVMKSTKGRGKPKKAAVGGPGSQATLF